MDEEEWLQKRYHSDLPPEAERALRSVGLCWEDGPAAEGHIKRALEIAPDHLATHYGAFKFYYYQRRLPECLPHIDAWMREGIKRNNLPADWRDVRPSDANFDDYDGDPRMFLFSLRAKGWLLAKLRRFEEGSEILKKVAELDPKDHMGARKLLAIIESGTAPADAAAP